MKLYCKEKDYTLFNGSMLDMLEVVKPNSVDAIVCDPPYELNFMGKGWDNSGIAFSPDAWGKCFEVLKDGGYLLAFGGSRTYHRIACAIEDAGFEIRDCIMWLYGSGFPKSMNLGLAIDKKNGVESEIVGINKSVQDLKEVGKITGHKMTFGQEGTQNCARKDVPILKARNQWDGWGTCLKPAYEPIIVARKPFKGSLIENIMENGVGGLNIDECRVAFDGEDAWKPQKSGKSSRAFQSEETTTAGGECTANENGRFPANVILTYDDTDFEEVCGGFPDTKSGIRKPTGGIILNPKDGWNNNSMIDKTERGFNDEGSAARYFYCAKASKKDRDEGLEKFETKTKVFNGKSDSSSEDMKDVEKRFTTNGKNIHPTVKPIELMQYLIRLVAPKGATIMDCFMGSGSTGKAAMFENRERNANYHFIGIELTDEYLPICKSRIDYAINKYEYDLIKEQKDKEKETGQTCLDLFGDD